MESIVNSNKYSSSTAFKNNKYYINSNAYKYSYADSSRTESIHYSVSKLYFKKPLHLTEVYAETYGVFNKIIETKNQEYHLNVNNSKQGYRYENGSLVFIEMINAIKNFEIIKLNE